MLEARHLSHALGFAGLLLTALAAYASHAAVDGGMLDTWRWSLVLALLATVFVHYLWLAADALGRRRWAWAVALLVAPVPVYWLYFLRQLVDDRRGA